MALQRRCFASHWLGHSERFGIFGRFYLNYVHCGRRGGAYLRINPVLLEFPLIGFQLSVFRGDESCTRFALARQTEKAIK